MPSRLERVIADQRSALLNRDEATARTILRAIETARKRLQPLIAAAQAEVNRLTAPSDAAVYELERWRNLEAQLIEQMEALARTTGIRLTRDQQQAIAQANADAKALATATTQQQAARALAAKWSAVPEQAMQQLVAAITPTSPVGKLLGSFGREAAAAARAALVEGVALSLTTDAVANAIQRALEVTRNRALMIARTEIMRAQRSALLQVYQANADILSGWRWHAARTTRTCPACLAMDGTVFQLDVRFFPGHPGCRCTALPELKDDGTSPMRPASEWFASLDAATQDGIVGKLGGSLYRAGRLELEDFAKRHDSPTWGASYTDGGVSYAMAQAAKRRRAA